MASELFVDNITGKTGTSGGAPITLSGDTATITATLGASSTANRVGTTFSASGKDVLFYRAAWYPHGLSQASCTTAEETPCICSS